MENRGSADDDDESEVDSSVDGSKKNDNAEELSSDFPSMAMSSAPSGSHSCASLLFPSASEVNEDDDCDHATVRCTKLLEHAPPSEPIPSTGLGMIELLERPTVVFARNHEVAPGAFHVHVPPSRNTATRRTSRSPIRSYDSTRALMNEESKQDEGVPNSAEAHTSSHDRSRIATESGLLTVEAQLAPDRSEEGRTIIAEAKSVILKWYHRPLIRWILGCGLVGAVVVIIVAVAVIVALVGRQPSAATSSSSLTPPTSKPTSVMPVVIACKFLSIPDVTKCRSTLVFDSYNYANDKTTGSTIPSEIGLLTQLTYMSFYSNSLTSSIPSEIGLLTQLTALGFFQNVLKGTLPSSLCSLPSLYSNVAIDCGEITCDSGCCHSWDATDNSSFTSFLCDY